MAGVPHLSMGPNGPKGDGVGTPKVPINETPKPSHHKSLKEITNTKITPSIRMKALNMNKITISTPRARTPRPTPRSALTYIRDAIETHTMGERAGRSTREIKDPFVGAEGRSGTRKFKISKKIWLVLPFVMSVSWVLLFICFGIDAATQKWTYTPAKPPYYDYSIYAAIFTILNPTPEQSRAVMESVTNTMAFIFGLLVTIIGIILQFASEKVTSHVTSLFLKDKMIVSSLAFVLICNAFALWVYLEIGPNHAPRFGVVVTVMVVNIQLVMLFPFLAYLFFFLDPAVVVENIMVNGLNAVINSINLQQSAFERSKKGTSKKKQKERALVQSLNEKNQVSATLSVDYLMDGAISSLKKKNKNIASEILDALCSFCMHYADIKNKAPRMWFAVSEWIRRTPDFLILDEDSIFELTERQLWVEWKVLRSFQSLYIEAIRWFKELCYHICINTRIIAETAASKQQYYSLDLCIKFFNTYLRVAINNTDVRVVYNTLFQYRQLAETLLDREHGATKHMAVRGLRIAKFMRYYAHATTFKQLWFLVETTAQDLRVILQQAVRSFAAKTGKAGVDTNRAVFREVHEKLLAIFLSMADIAGGAARGVIRAQIMLATFYLEEKQPAHARKIFESLRRDGSKDREELLRSLDQELSKPSTKEFWEVSERSSNFSYMEPAWTRQVSTFFGWFSWYKSHDDNEEWDKFWSSPAGKQLKVTQELNNFEVELSDDEESEEEDFDQSDDGDDDDDILSFEQEDESQEMEVSSVSVSSPSGS